MSHPIVPEFSRVFQLEKNIRIPNQIKPTSEELKALAKRFDLREIKSFSIEFVLHQGQQEKEYEAEGKGHAEVVQACVVTLKDVPATVAFSFHVKLVEGKEEVLEEMDDSFLEEEMDVDYYQNGQIDMGEIAAQYLSLSLDPYPKAVETASALPEGQEETEKSGGAFAILQQLKDTSSGKE